MRRRSIVSIGASVTALLTMMMGSTAAAETPGAAPADKLADTLAPAAAATRAAATAAEKAQLRALGSGPEARTYLIRLQDPAVPTYTGGVAGMPRTAPAVGRKLNAASPAAREYRSHLVAEQAGFVTAMEKAVGHEVEVPFTYQHAVNGLAAVLTPAEAREIAGRPEVASIELDVERELHTDNGPVWSGADHLWNAVADLGLPEDYQGEGIVIGTIDTGISPGNRSFAETGDDGYTHTNPLGDGVFLGACDPGNTEQFDPDFPCNNKLIGAYVFGGANDSALDRDGHGSHTASTSGGNVVSDAQIQGPTVTTEPVEISGVAPHANVISYLGCCTTAGLVASIDQAIADGVDVINYSIGSSSPGDPWTNFDAVGFLNARAAGIFVATSNGNDGPGDATTGSPASAPWLTAVGASTHDRWYENAVIEMTSSAGDLADLVGKGVSGSLPPTPIVYAGDFGNAVCADGVWAPGTFNGEIVVCDRGGEIGRVAKSFNAADAGAGGFIHVNDPPNGDSLNADAFAVPGVHLTHDQGVILKDWLANGASDHTGAIRGTERVVDPALGDIMAAFSSRGPNQVIDVIVPHVTAPGVDILAAIGADSPTVDEHGIISGTSMSSPHVAGAGALLMQARPDWTPAQIQSALMTTGRDVLNHDGTPATPYAQGSGHINIDQAVRAGLLFDETFANYLAANPAEGGDPKTLNLPSMSNTSCLSTCTWVRTATVPASAPAGVTWTASATGDAGLNLSVAVSPDPATLSPGDTLEITVTADVLGAPNGQTLFGEVVLTPDNPDVPAAGLPVAVVPVAGTLPGALDVDTRRNAGSELVAGIETIEVTEFTGSVRGFVRATMEESTLAQDPTNGDPYDDLSQVDVYLLDVPEGATRLVAEMVDAAMSDADLFVGTGDTPSAATEVCASTSPTAAELCDVADPAAGTWWVMLQNWESSAEGVADAYTLATAVVPGESLGNGDVAGPSGPVPPGETYDVRVTWDIPELAAGDIWYGTAVLGSAPDRPGDIGSFPVTLRRVGDDVTKTADVTQAAPGEVVTYQIEVAPNVTGEDLEYTITDTIPEGLTYVDGSVTGGATVENGVVSWTGTMPTASGLSGSYEVATNATDASCDTPFGGYVDLREFGILPQPGVEGDTVAFTAFAGGSPFEFYGTDYVGMGFTDDGFALFDVADNYGGSPWAPQQLPDPALPDNLIAALWHDFELVYDQATDRGVSLATAGTDATGLAVVDFRGVQRFGDPSGEQYTFQIMMQRQATDGWQIFVAFDQVGPLTDPFTIGVENAGGTSADALVNSASADGVVGPGTVVCFAYQEPTLEPHVITYQATVDPTAASGVYTNQAVHITDDPFAQEATASVDVEVTGGGLDVTSITVEPLGFRLKPGETRQLTAIGHLDGGGTVDVTDSVTWATGNPLVVTVDEAGLVTGVGGIRTTVTATLDSVVGTAYAHVTGRPVRGVHPGML